MTRRNPFRIDSFNVQHLFAGALAVLGALAIVAVPRSVPAGTHKLTEQENRRVQVDGATRIYVKNSRGKTIMEPRGKQNA